MQGAMWSKTSRRPFAGSGPAIAVELDPRKGSLVTVTGVIGASLLGAGTLLAIGANWDQIESAWKILIMTISIVACYIAGWRLKCTTGNKPRVGEALILLGALLYGAGIWLSAQIFHFEVDFAWGTLLWAMGVIPIALLFGSGVLAVLVCILLNSWLFMQPYSMDRTLFWGFASLAVAYAVRSPWALSKVLTGTALWAMHHASMGPVGLAISGVGMWAWYLWHSQNQKWNAMAKPYLYIGPICVMLALLHMSDHCLSHWFKSSNEYGIWPMILLLAFAGSGIVAACKYAQILFPELLGCIVAGTGLIGLKCFAGGDLTIICANVLLLAILIGFLFTGFLRISSPILVSTTLFFLVADVLMRYFDEHFMAMERSVFLFAGGGLLLLIAVLMERSKSRPMNSSVQQASGEAL